jgi:hypothetical protein
VGASVMNALSIFAKVEVHREGKIFMQEYSKGIAKAKVKEIGKTKFNGTIVTFKPDIEIFKEALTTNVADDDINFKDIYYEMLEDSGLNLNEPEIMLFMIVELISSTCYSSILYKEPADIDRLKPYLYKAIKAIINEHTIED